jgi:hypothetical protein
MFADFKSLSPSSRIWIYQSDKKISQQQENLISRFLKDYCETWVAHGQPLKASFEIRHSHFIVIVADESFNATSGCSVDDSVRAVKEIERQTGLQFFNRNLIPFMDGERVFLVDLATLKQKYAEGIWNEQTLTLSNQIATKGQLESDWILPAGNTWLKRYLPKETVKR